jgi:hypothetical protein
LLLSSQMSIGWVEGTLRRERGLEDESLVGPR